MMLLIRTWDILLTAALFLLMLAGYALFFFLYPFYRFPWWARFIFVSAIFLVSIAAVGYFAFLKTASDPRTDREKVESILIIEKGSNLDIVSQILRQYNLIESPLRFRILATLKGESTRLKAGRYRFDSQMSLSEILERLAKGSVYNNNVIVPEGLPSWEIAALFQRMMDLDSAAFMARVNDSVFARSLGINARSLEGYLFPDTYYFRWDATLEDVLRILVGRFSKVYAAIHADNAITRRYSMQQIVTLASIVENEAINDEERSVIAGVFYNRLKKRIPLGADPTVCYAVGKFGQPPTKADLAVKSPYNTRIMRGLPPGPICSPGEASLRAAMDPAETPMLFFVAKNDGSNGHYFTATHEDHLRMKQVARQTRRPGQRR